MDGINESQRQQFRRAARTHTEKPLERTTQDRQAVAAARLGSEDNQQQTNPLTFMAYTSPVAFSVTFFTTAKAPDPSCLPSSYFSSTLSQSSSNTSFSIFTNSKSGQIKGAGENAARQCRWKSGDYDRVLRGCSHKHNADARTYQFVLRLAGLLGDPPRQRHRGAVAEHLLVALAD